ncbi:hypothetical protein G7Y89_g3938 [Cudoniella acicularis]|uniref:Heterokaryon incompatibility domain-containing protein n=1 Tax=Cudoniella acicularis TaxID=354080 RepID=A0A8H4RR95_9HELO|nr:hypothetical protein G7Y89_g3938 [Cudoniella acicularis]
MGNSKSKDGRELQSKSTTSLLTKSIWPLLHKGKQANRPETKASLLELGTDLRLVSGSPEVCDECMKIFESLDCLKDLTSEEGLRVERRDPITDAVKSCPICRAIRQGFFRWLLYPRLKADCGEPASDEESNQALPTYPSTILAVKHICFGGGGSPHWQNMLAIYAIPDDPATEYLRCLPYKYEMAGRLNIQEAKRKLRECQMTHSSCSRVVTPLLPRRVVDVMASEGPRYLNLNLKLHVTSSGDRGHYVALSYCWGKKAQAKTTMENYESMTQGISFDILSQSIKDAIKITRKLGIRYLWVNALCIVQDSLEDKTREIDGMGRIYSNATLTLAAGNSQSAQEGFLAPKTPLKGYQLPFLLPDGSYGQVMAVPCKPGQDLAGRFPLNSRGWAFQEYILSTRVLFFGHGDVMWKCRMTPLVPLFSTPFTSAPELFRNVYLYPGISRALEKPQRDWPSSEKSSIWAEIVQSYNNRELSLREDRLPALAGIAERLDALWNDRYLAGLWKSCLLQQLCWYKLRADDLPSNEPYLGPSWSWVSVDPPILFGEPPSSVDVEILECSVELTDSNARFGKVKSGILTLSTLVLPRSYFDNQLAINFDHTYDMQQYKDTRFHLFDPFVMVKLGNRRSSSSLNCVLALAVKDIGDGKFRRVGFFDSCLENRYDERVWERAERKLITIV